MRNFTSSFPRLSGNHQRLSLPQARPEYPFGWSLTCFNASDFVLRLPLGRLGGLVQPDGMHGEGAVSRTPNKGGSGE
jgi:hypothetical protein